MRFIIAMIIDLDLLKFKCFKIDKKNVRYLKRNLNQKL